MSQKRRAKVEKRKRKNKKTKSANTKPIAKPKQSAPTIENPYSSPEEGKADLYLMNDAWKEHFENVDENFSPPLLEQDGTGMKAAPWIGTYRDILFEKYKSMDLVEPRLKFNLMVLGDTLIDGGR